MTQSVCFFIFVLRLFLYGRVTLRAYDNIYRMYEYIETSFVKQL